MKILSNIAIVLLLCLWVGEGWAQPIGKAALPAVSTDGFYAIDLPYQVLGGACRDKADIRIKRADGTEVAWLLREDVEQNLINIPLEESVIKKKGKETDIRIVLPFRCQISNLLFYISSPAYYNRKLSVSDSAYGSFTETLSASGDSLQVLSCNLYTDTLRMSVYNGDDQPLKIDSIKVLTPKVYLIAALKGGEAYSLTYGDKQAVFPQYDLSFRTQLPDSLGHLTLGEVELLPLVPPLSEPSSWWLPWLKQYGIWIVIVLVILQILYMVRKMMK